MASDFTNNADRQRFEYDVDGQTVFANYKEKNDTLYINYVEAPPELRGSGAAEKLMQYIVDDAKTRDLKIIPICGYAASWMRKHKIDF